MVRALSPVPSSPFLSKSNLCRPSPSSCIPMMVARPNSQSYWTSIEADVEAHLQKAIPIRPPTTVFEPMHYLVFAAPKTKAPALCVAACELVGGHQDQAMAAASALHLMHSAAYTHEHLPLTDKPIPKPTIHHAYGPNIELLTGDGIVPFGFELLARSIKPAQNNSGRILRVIVEITRAVGSQGIVDGQYRQLRRIQSNFNSSSDKQYDEEWVEHVLKKKEGEIHACGAACGAILGGGSEEEIERLRKCGLYVGMIQGVMNVVGENEKKGFREVVERLGEMAMKELEIFNGRKVEPISSLIEASLGNV
ncbi:Transferase of alkyl or aryl groups [Sarracenia purpurea var. burkii]